MRLTRNQLYVLSRTWGSNPYLTANNKKSTLEVLFLLFRGVSDLKPRKGVRTQAKGRRSMPVAESDERRARSKA